MNEFNQRREKLDKQVLNELYMDLGYVSKVILDGDSSKKSTKDFENIEKVIERWQSRNGQDISLENFDSLYKSIDELKPSDILVCGQVPSKLESKIQEFDNVYVILGDYNTVKPRGNGNNVVDIVNSKYMKYIKGGDVVVYYGNYTDKNKLRSKIWSYGDIRSYKSIDTSYYEKYFDPDSGRIPSAAVATCLMIIKQYNTKPFLSGIELADMSAWDQQIIKKHGIRLCM
jgi:hypothetical protein